MSRISDLAGFTTALSTTQDLSVGVITATSFSGDGSGLTGVASTDNIQTATDAKFLANVNITGITTATGGFVGDLTGDVTGNTSGTAGGLTGTPNITVGSVTAASGSFSGNVTIGGTLTYQDVTNIDSVGIITAQQGIQVLANGLTITGVSTFNDNVDLQDNDKILLGSSDDLEIYHNGTDSLIDNVGAGDLYLRNQVDDKDVIIQSDNGSGATATYIQCDGSSGAVILTHYGTEKFTTTTGGVEVTGSVTATSFSGDGSALTGIEAGITTTEKTASANSTVFLGLSTAQHHTINVVAGITTIDCTGGSVGDSHSVVIINPSSVGTGVTVGFATDFLFPSGSVPSLPTGANDISLISFIVKQTGAGGTEVLASAGLNYSN